MNGLSRFPRMTNRHVRKFWLLLILGIGLTLPATHPNFRASYLLAEEENLDEDFEELDALPEIGQPRAAANEEEKPESSEDPSSRVLEKSLKKEQASGEESAQVEPTEKNKLLDVRFRMVDQNSRILLDFEKPPVYQEGQNAQVKQYVYTFANTEANHSIQRAYDTSEFLSPVALFTVIQMPKKKVPLTKLIVQLREAKVPTLSVSQNQLVIDFPPPDARTLASTVETEVSEEPFLVEDNIYKPNRKFTGEKIERLEIKNSDVQDVIRLIAKSSGYNVVIGEDVKGTVGTLSLEGVPWDQALTLVLQSKQLGYARQGNVIRIASLASLKAEKDAALANQQSQIQVEPLKTVLIPISYARALDLAPRAKPFLSERGVVETDERTNTIIVKDVGKVIERIQKLLLALDTQPQKVSISAKIVEMLSTFTRDIGFTRLAASGTTSSGLNVDASLQPSVHSGAFALNIRAPRFANLETTFRLGELDGKTRTLANPVISAVANQTAQIAQSISFFVQDVVVVGGTGVPTLKQVTANLSLNVTPIVSGDGSIFMNVKVRNEVPTGIGEASQQIDTRSLETQVLVDNGDTAVIGGIFNSTSKEDVEGIPFLMRVPILGFFMRGNRQRETRNEILVFLTPKILNVEESFRRSF